jgi:peptide-methionine (S)-S-oxide reductase
MISRTLPLVASTALCSALTHGRTAVKQPRTNLRMLGFMFGQKDAEMVQPERALPGRQQKMRVPDRHYVLGNKMEGPYPEGYKVAVFANGCFWGSEKGIWRLPGDGIYTTAVGYAAGYTPNPTYEEACSGQSGHTEAVQVVYDPARISFVDILRWFWEAHDPAAGMGQGNDRGTQYRSGFYYFDEEQKALIESSRAAYQSALKAKGINKPITTEVAAASDYDKYGGVFYFGEGYHQQYLAKPGARPYCSAQPQQVSLPPFEEWAPAALAHHAPKLPEAFWSRHGPKPHCVIRSPNEPIPWGDW